VNIGSVPIGENSNKMHPMLHKKGRKEREKKHINPKRPLAQVTVVESTSKGARVKVSRPSDQRFNIRRNERQNLEKIMGPLGFQLFRSVLSPAEFKAPCGWMDATQAKTMILRKVDQGIRIKALDSYTSGRFSVLMMQVSSPEISCISWTRDGLVNSDTQMPWDQTSTGWSSPTIHYWADVVHQVYDETNNQYAFGDVNMPKIGAAAPLAAADPTSVYKLPIMVTDWRTHFKQTRFLGGSITGHLDAQAITNEGIVYQSRMPDAPQCRTIRADLLGFKDAADNQVFRWEGPMNVYQSMPSDFGQMLALSDTYHTRAALDGNYTIMQLKDAELKLDDTQTCRALLSFSPARTDADETLEDIPLAETALIGGTSYQVPVAPLIDTHWAPSLILYNGIDKQAAVTFKVVANLEATPSPNSTFAYCSSPSPPKNVAFLESMNAAATLVPDGAPASANDFLDTLKAIGAELWSVLKGVLPGLILKGVAML